MNRSPEQIYDELLVLRCQDGEKSAWTELAERWQGRLHRHAFRLAANREVAADAVQEAWLAIVRNIGKLDDPASFRAWAYRIVTHKCTDQVRRAMRRRKLDEQLTHEPEPEPVSPEPLGEDDELARLRRAMADLPQDRRAILALHYLEGAGVAEIASIFRIPEGTVKSRLWSARKALRKVLDPEASNSENR